jgi:hypothetical protein
LSAAVARTIDSGADRSVNLAHGVLSAIRTRTHCSVVDMTVPLVGVELVHVPDLAQRAPDVLHDPHLFERCVQRISCPADGIDPAGRAASAATGASSRSPCAPSRRLCGRPVFPSLTDSLTAIWLSRCRGENVTPWSPRLLLGNKRSRRARRRLRAVPFRTSCRSALAYAAPDGT